MDGEEQSRFERFLDLERTYLDGKMKRYGLLFAVNGGAFAIIQLAAENGCPTEGAILNRLTTTQLAVGAIAFTGLMFSDIWRYGTYMRGLEKGFFNTNEPRLFTRFGQVVLVLVVLLLALAWGLAFPGVITLIAMLITLVGCALVMKAEDPEPWNRASGHT